MGRASIRHLVRGFLKCIIRAVVLVPVAASRRLGAVPVVVGVEGFTTTTTTTTTGMHARRRQDTVSFNSMMSGFRSIRLRPQWRLVQHWVQRPLPHLPGILTTNVDSGVKFRFLVLLVQTGARMAPDLMREPVVSRRLLGVDPVVQPLSELALLFAMRQQRASVLLVIGSSMFVFSSKTLTRKECMFLHWQPLWNTFAI
jgi:hypothetical protein